MARDYDAFRLRAVVMQILHDLEAAAFREEEVGDDEVELFFGEPRQGPVLVLGLGDLKTDSLQIICKAGPEYLLVLNKQNIADHRFIPQRPVEKQLRHPPR